MPSGRCRSCTCICCREPGLSYSGDEVEFYREPDAQRNYVSAAFGIFAFIFLSTALADEHWFAFHGGSCNVRTIGLVPFFFNGKFVLYTNEKTNKITTKYTYNGKHQSELINCVDSKVVLVLRTIMVLLFLSSLFSSLQAFFDLLGARRSFFKAFQLYAIGSVTTVLLCVANLWLSYVATVLLTDLQRRCTVQSSGSKASPPAAYISIGFYLNAGAAAAALLAVCSTCFAFGDGRGGRRWASRCRPGHRRGSSGPLAAQCDWRCHHSPPRDVNDLQSLLLDDDVPLLIPVEAPPAYTP